VTTEAYVEFKDNARSYAPAVCLFKLFTFICVLSAYPESQLSQHRPCPQITNPNCNIASVGSTVNSRSELSRCNIASVGSTVNSRSEFSRCNITSVGSTVNSRSELSCCNIASVGSTVNSRSELSCCNIASVGSTVNSHSELSYCNRSQYHRISLNAVNNLSRC